MHRWYICGLREVRKAVKHRKAHTIILAPNIEQIEADGALNDHVEAIIAACKETDTPVVFALSRKKLGEIYGVRKRMSAIALLEIQGVQELVARVWALAEEGRRAWDLNRGPGSPLAAARAAAAAGLPPQALGSPVAAGPAAAASPPGMLL
jgi:selenocysteine insertion sequence-binding protein 2